ncbi:hypothetical protein HYS11_00285 [Candidatus Gottesmanbacteria bacterium]|nr:hypothetical protein [Candidatus Gottesmanbacteria bacterium]
MQENFLIYNRSAKPCLNSCGNIIKKFVIAGRGTFYCPKCQK